jgi:hypothetical protein
MTLRQDPATLTRSQRIRVWIGTFIVDYVETFLGLVPAQLLIAFAVPTSSITDATASVYAWAIQLGAPALAALVSAGRRALANAWPALKAFFASGFGAIKS